MSAPSPDAPVARHGPEDSLLPQVLLVVDDALDRRVAARLLERLGCQVDVAADQLAALAALERKRYRMVLVDGPTSSAVGPEPVRCLRMRDAVGGPGTRVLALAASTLPGEVERCLAAGMDGVLARPVRLADLRAALAGTRRA